MTNLTGLFLRGSSYYLRVVLPADHPALPRHKNGRLILSLGACSRRDAILKGTLLRGEVLSGGSGVAVRPATPAVVAVEPSPMAPAKLADAPETATYLRDVFNVWTQAKPRSTDTIASCRRALEQFEQQTGNPPLAGLNRASGVAFRAWMQQPERNLSSKSANDRLTWIKSLLKFALVDMEIISRSPWQGLTIDVITENKRRPWSEAELKKLFSQPLHVQRLLPKTWKAGSEAAYWIPLLGIYTGARVGELSQMRVEDVDTESEVPMLCITDEGDGQKVKTDAGVRSVPVHSELVRLGFLDYVRDLKQAGEQRLWPRLLLHDKKPGTYFSNWFGEYRRHLGFGKYPDFHCLRHTVRSALASADIAEPMIDQLVGHAITGSTGARTYTHRTVIQMKSAIERLTFPTTHLQRLYLAGAST